MDKTLLNQSGCMDKTAHAAINNAEREKVRVTVSNYDRTARDEAADVLIKTIKNAIWLSGFKLADRIKLEDPKTGKKYL